MLRFGALTAAVVSISCAAIWIELAEAPALTIASNRMLVAIVLLVPPTLLFGRQELSALSRGEIGWTILAGLSLAAHFGLWTMSLGYTTVASSVAFVCTHPVFVALAEWAWLGQRLSRAAWAGILLTLVGSFVIGWSDLAIGGTALYGDLLATAGAIALVGYLIVGRRLRRKLGFLLYSLLVFAPCWLALLMSGLATGAGPLDFGPGDPPLFLALGLISTLGGHAVFNWALRYVPASVVAASFVAEPAISAVLAWIILLQQPPTLTLVGGAIILAGIYLAARR